MNHDSDPYEVVAQVYTRLVEKDSPSAATAIRALQRQAGAQAALRAALIITLVKRQIQDDRYLPNLKEYAYLFRDYSETIWLLEEALAHCLCAWGFPDVTVALDIGNPPREIE